MPEDLGAGPGVEVAGGFVCEDDRGATDEGPCARDALLLPAGESSGWWLRLSRIPRVSITVSNHALSRRWRCRRAG